MSPDGEDAVSLNGWPGGPRTLRCLRCGADFVSGGRQNRLCAPCATADDGDGANLIAPLP